MNAGTKVFLAVVALLVGAMILYYGVLQPGDHPSSAKGGTPEAPVVRGSGTANETGRSTFQPVLRNDSKPAPASEARNAAPPTPITPATDPLADLGANATSNANGFLSDTINRTTDGGVTNHTGNTHSPAGTTGDPGHTAPTGLG